MGETRRQPVNREIEAQSSRMRVQIQGVVRRIWHRSAETGWTVLGVQPDGESALIRAVGVLQEPPAVGQRLRVCGYWQTSAKWGRELIIEKLAEPWPETVAGLEALLASGAFRGIGPVLARRLVCVFGTQLPEIVERQPSRLLDVPGIGETHAAILREGLGLESGSILSVAELRRLGLTKVEALRIAYAGGENAAAELVANPYLAWHWGRLSWARVDALARQRGIGSHDPRRLAMAVQIVLSRYAEQGAVWVREAEVLRETSTMTEVSVADLERAFATSNQWPQIVRHHADRTWMGLFAVVIMEQAIETALTARLQEPDTERPSWAEPDPAWPSGLMRLWEAACIRRWLELDGWLGTMAERWIIKLGELLASRRVSWVMLVASEAERARWGSWIKDAENTVLALTRASLDLHGAEVVIGWDAGAWNLAMWQRAVGAAPKTARWWLWGDTELPGGTGPGRVFQDLAATGVGARMSLPIVGADRRSLRMEWSMAVRRQTMPALRETTGADLTWVEVSENGVLIARLEAWLEQHPEWNRETCVVLTPAQGSPCGAQALNRRLQARWNAEGRSLPESEMRVGDPVLVRFDDVGEEYGVLSAYDADAGQAIVRTGSSERRIPYWDWDRLSPAYAVAGWRFRHRRWPYVAIVLGPAATRGWLAAALAVATREAVIIGTIRGLARAVRSQHQVRGATAIFRAAPSDANLV